MGELTLIFRAGGSRLPLQILRAYVNGKDYRLRRGREVVVPLTAGPVRMFITGGLASSPVLETSFSADDHARIEVRNDVPLPTDQNYPWEVKQVGGPEFVEVEPGRLPGGPSGRQMVAQAALTAVLFALWRLLDPGLLVVLVALLPMVIVAWIVAFARGRARNRKRSLPVLG